MAYTTQTFPGLGARARSAAHIVGGFFASIGKAMVVNSTAYARLERVEALHAKTDAELAALGLDRDEIVRHVFRDLY